MQLFEKDFYIKKLEKDYELTRKTFENYIQHYKYNDCDDITFEDMIKYAVDLKFLKDLIMLLDE